MAQQQDMPELRQAEKMVGLSIPNKAPDIDSLGSTLSVKYNDRLAKRDGPFTRERPPLFPDKVPEAISPDEKQKMFAPAIESMKQICETMGVNLPPDLMDRLLILGPQAYGNLHVAENMRGYTDEKVMGHALVNRLATVNVSAISDKYNFKDVSPEAVSKRILTTGIHELWHTLGNAELWVSEDQKDNWQQKADLEKTKQYGLSLHAPDKQTNVNVGIAQLNEGLTEYLTRLTIQNMGAELPPEYQMYSPQTEVVEDLVQDIGLQVLADAAFKPDGFKGLSQAFTEKYGKGSLKKFALLMQRDYYTHKGSEHPSRHFKITKDYLARAKVEKYFERKPPVAVIAA